MLVSSVNRIILCHSSLRARARSSFLFRSLSRFREPGDCSWHAVRNIKCKPTICYRRRKKHDLPRPRISKKCNLYVSYELHFVFHLYCTRIAEMLVQEDAARIIPTRKFDEATVLSMQRMQLLSGGCNKCNIYEKENIKIQKIYRK